MTKQITSLFMLIIGLSIISISCSPKKELNKTSNILQDTIVLNFEGKDIQFVVDFEKGKAHNHPTFAFWLEDLEGNYIQTLFVTRSIATGIFGYAETESGKWLNKKGKAYRPAALPYWQHKKGKQEDNNVDAYTGATPKSSFRIKTGVSNLKNSKFNLLFEINQPWDWNSHWNNNKFPDNQNYKTSCQPSLVYSVRVNLEEKDQPLHLNAIGHGHYAGEDGKLYTDLTTLTTALEIVEKIKITVK